MAIPCVPTPVSPLVSPGNGMAELLRPIAAEMGRVETRLTEQSDAFEPSIRELARHVLGGGKRLRPVLALLAGGATGQIGEEHIKLSVIVELIHVATLVHDDVLDEAQLRHRLPTANARWGNEVSVLLGDCLFAQALRLGASFSTPLVCRQISEATRQVCAGELSQTQRRFAEDLPLEEYLEMVRMKTGALFAVSTELGALLNDAPPSVVKALREFGDELGVAYQIYDDCVDLFGQEPEAGKSLGTDMKTGKMTLPVLLLLRHQSASARQELCRMVFHSDSEDRRRVIALARSNGVLPESLATIRRHIEQAGSKLAALPSNPFADLLRSLAWHLHHRSGALLQETSVS